MIECKNVKKSPKTVAQSSTECRSRSGVEIVTRAGGSETYSLPGPCMMGPLSPWTKEASLLLLLLVLCCGQLLALTEASTASAQSLRTSEALGSPENPSCQQSCGQYCCGRCRGTCRSSQWSAGRFCHKLQVTCPLYAIPYLTCCGRVLQVTRQLSTQRRQWFMGNSTAALLHSRQCVGLGSQTSSSLTQQRLLCTPVGSSTLSSSRRTPTAHKGAPAQHAT